MNEVGGRDNGGFDKVAPDFSLFKWEEVCGPISENETRKEGNCVVGAKTWFGFQF